MTALNLHIMRLSHAEGLPLPRYATQGSAGLDLVAAVPEHEPIILAPGKYSLIPTGLCLQIPDGYEAQIRPRSGLAAKHGLCVLNAPGTIDSDYRGEVSVLLINHGSEAFVIRRGMRIAQMVIAAFTKVNLLEVHSLIESTRGTGGFGSTGVETSC